ncbi:SWI/SNF chromatin remodeling complex component [Peziza echinospora]|nr:SWI/SNF chromatin remodeling complex component [Peziza echinospora]
MPKPATPTDGSQPILNPEKAPEDKNWLRLQFLLNQSKVYASILSEKFKQSEAQRYEREKKSEEQISTPPKTPANGTVTPKGPVEAEASEVKDEEDLDPDPEVPTLGKRTRSQKDLKVPAPRKKRATTMAIRQKTAATKQKKAETTGSIAEALAAAVDEENNNVGEKPKQLRSARQPKLVTGGIMKPYQLEGLDWLCSLYENGLNGILADEMGLGKTLQTISFLAFLREKKTYGPFLIVAPVSTLSNWVEEIERFTPDMPAVLYHGTPQEREEIRSKRLRTPGGPDFPIVCTSYELIMRDKKALQRFNWSFIIIDEGHRIKNLNCKLIRELKSYTSANRLLLTGTPLQNNLSELWSLLNFLLPDIFDDLDSFQGWFDFSALQEKEGHKQILEADRKTQIVSSLHAILKPFLLRRIKADVETCLPPKREYVLYAPLTQEQKDLYLALVEARGKDYLVQKLMGLRKDQEDEKAGRKKNNIAEILNGYKKEKSEKKLPNKPEGRGGRRRRKKTDYRELEDDEWLDKLDAETLYLSEDDDAVDVDAETAAYQRQLTEATKEVSAKKLQNLVMQLRLACNSPHLFYWPWSEDAAPDQTLLTSSGKLLLLDHILPQLFARNHKVLIFSQFTTQLDILESYARDLKGWPVARIDGSVALTDRRAQIKEFNENPEWRLFLLSTRAGGLGINLTSADTVILFDSDWNPQMDLQAMDRAHRIGQVRPVIVYRFATAGTVEEALLERADAKRRLERLVIWKGKFKGMIENPSSKLSEEMEEEKAIESIIMREDFEKVAVVGEGSVLLSEEELEVLMDRSPEAYERAARGEEKSVMGKGQGWKSFKVAETVKEEGGGVKVEVKEEKDKEKEPGTKPGTEAEEEPEAGAKIEVSTDGKKSNGE